ncbi:MerR family transcriptional regulator [Pseudaestuariivita rosea]|uniref:MerR family transcriptional regulator n=1 Tax=Pseudaestuariivita rosea TaxID=2763263 RepID=UPI001ABA734F|nr:MerR family transcriptional regulator [Pseudaestuariivita rosea]
MKLELETYLPAEAEEITGVKQTTVRNWRRAGHLPRHQGHARYNLADMLVMFVMGMLVSRGMTPEAAKEFSGQTARAIFQSAIHSKQTFSDSVRAEAKAEMGEIPDDEVAELKAQIGDGFRLDMIEWARCQKIMMNAAEQLAGISGVEQPEWLIVWAHGESQFLYDGDPFEDTFLANTFFSDHSAGPITLFHLDTLAQMVIERLPRPAIRLADQ